jgi:hypothetical protein
VLSLCLKVVSRLKETKFAREGIMLDRYEYKSPVMTLILSMYIQFLQDACVR